MSLIQAYDGSSGWQINPFEGRRDPELLGEDDLRDLVYQADFYGPLVDYKEKGNKIEYLGKDTVDGDDVYRLKVTLKNGEVTVLLPRSRYLPGDSYGDAAFHSRLHSGVHHELRQLQAGEWRLLRICS